MARMLVVEPNDDVRALIADVLTSGGHLISRLVYVTGAIDAGSSDYHILLANEVLSS